jgi:bacteriorhodopsin
MKQNFSNDILMRSIKIVDIGYIAIIYIIFAIILSRIVDEYMGEFDEKKEENKPLWQVFIEFILILWLYGVIIYIARNLAELIPFPLNGYNGFDHYRVKELYNASIFTLTFYVFCDNLKQRLSLFDKIVKKELDKRKQKKNR